ncbi:MAG: DinB family protein [Planctomycetota bacterium]
MNARALIDRLERFADILPAVVDGLSEADARWRPDGTGWSILEIVTHMADEEVEDFRQRVELTLRDPEAAWPPIDPEGWAVERRYNEGRLAEVVERFYRHPKIGAMHAGEVFTAWAAHDALHLRQIAKRLYQMTARDGGEYGPDYAGSWTA